MPVQRASGLPIFVRVLVPIPFRLLNVFCFVLPAVRVLRLVKMGRDLYTLTVVNSATHNTR